MNPAGVDGLDGDADAAQPVHDADPQCPRLVYRPATAMLVIQPTREKMRRLNVAQAKAQLSALLVAVESGEDVEITLRVQPVARLTQAAEHPAAGFDLEAFLAVTSAQPLHKGMDAAALLQELREGARY